jgi:copper(I)-binding protein
LISLLPIHSIKVFIMLKFQRALLGAALCLSSVVAQAQDIQVEQPWSRAMPPTAPAAAAYFVLHNPGSLADRLIGASAPISARAELHEHAHVGGVMQMREVAGGIPLPAGGQVSFQPGGYHVMLLELPRQMKEGEQFPLTLRFEKAGELRVEVPVLRMAPAAQGGHQGH